MAQTKSSLLVGKKENVSDELLLLNPYQIPVLSLVGFGGSVTQTRYGWVEDKLQAMKDQLSAAINNAVTTVPVDNGTLFRADQVIKVGDELMLVTSVSGNNLTVTRGFGSTTAASALDNAVVEIMFNLKDEGSAARESKYKARVNKFNYTQIFDDSIDISGTAEATSQYGIIDLYMYERMKVQDRLALELENALVNGVKFEAGDKRMMGGIKQFITTNVTDAGAVDISFKLIDDAMLKIVKAGGTKDAARHVLMVSPTQLQKLVALDTDHVRVTQQETQVGRTVNVFVCPHGRMEIVENINFADDEVMVLDINRIEVKPLQGRAFTHTYLGKTGDNTKGQIVGEYTLEFNQEEAHARIKNLKVA